MRLFVLMASFACSVAAMAEPMRFQWGGSNGRCDGCGPFIQATGDITPQTPGDFRAFLKAEEFAPKLVRLHSEGGDLAAGLALGELFREAGISTEVGADREDRELSQSVGRRMSERTGGLCASACAYAFLGGVERTVDQDSKIGVHRFYFKDAVMKPTLRQFTGQDLDGTQRMVAGILLYVMRMGVDARLVSLAAEAGAAEMRWLSPSEVTDLKVAYEPGRWKPWRVEAYRGGALAVSETEDGTASMVASCSRKYGAQVALTDRLEGSEEWFRQVKDCTDDGRHPVFGTYVTPRNVGVGKAGRGGVIVFALPDASPPLTGPTLLEGGTYAMACRSGRYAGSKVNFVPAVRLALRNCLQD